MEHCTFYNATDAFVISFQLYSVSLKFAGSNTIFLMRLKYDDLIQGFCFDRLKKRIWDIIALFGKELL